MWYMCISVISVICWSRISFFVAYDVTAQLKFLAENSTPKSCLKYWEGSSICCDIIQILTNLCISSLNPTDGVARSDESFHLRFNLLLYTVPWQRVGDKWMGTVVSRNFQQELARCRVRDISSENTYHPGPVRHQDPLPLRSCQGPTVHIWESGKRIEWPDGNVMEWLGQDLMTWNQLTKNWGFCFSKLQNQNVLVILFS